MKRIKLSRKKGWRLPPNYKKVDRSSRWGNPYAIVKVDNGWRVRGAELGIGYVGETFDTKIQAAEYSVALFEVALKNGDIPDLDLLRGLDGLACWCKPGDPCHADKIIEYLESTKGE